MLRVEHRRARARRRASRRTSRCRRRASARPARCPARSTAIPMLALTTSSWPSIVERLAERVLDPLRRPRAARPRRVDVVEQDRELVAAEPGDRVAGPQVAASSRRAKRDQQLVADGVAEAVVDELEAVEVEEQHGAAVAGSRSARGRARARGGRGTAPGWAARSARRAARRGSSCSSAALRSVMSVIEPAMRVALPVAGRGSRRRARAPSGSSPSRCAHAVLALEVRAAALEVGVDRRAAARRRRRGGRARATPRASRRSPRRRSRASPSSAARGRPRSAGRSQSQMPSLAPRTASA